MLFSHFSVIYHAIGYNGLSASSVIYVNPLYIEIELLCYDIYLKSSGIPCKRPFLNDKKQLANIVNIIDALLKTEHDAQITF